MKALQKLVVAVLLGVWLFPAVGSATQSPGVAEVASPATRAPAAGSAAPASSQSEANALSAREQQSPALQDFRGGGVSIYIGSGVLLVLVIVLLILLI